MIRVSALIVSLALTGLTPVHAQSVATNPLLTKDFDAFKNKTLEQKVQELADREEIRELISTYAHRVAHRVPFSDLFTEDGVYINADGETRGRKNLAARWDRLGQGRPDPSLPQIHNYIISISGDEGTGICSNELRISEDGKSIVASGWYEDKYRRENGRWRFASRKITWFHWVPIQEGWATPVKPK